MTTFAYTLSEGISARLAEIREIGTRAESEFDKDPIIYDILCRSGSILIVSALEAFIKDLNTAIQSDLTSNISKFSDMPKKMQREFSEKIVYFEGVPEADIKKRSNQLLKFFENNSVKIDMGAFNYRESLNKNPSANMVDSAFNRYGINSILHCLSGSKFEAVFNNDSSTDFVLKREIIRLRATLFAFPYKPMPPSFDMKDWLPLKAQSVPNSIWHTFLENMLRRRHGVVHADTRDNPTSWQAINDDSNKLEILFSGLLFAASSLIGKDIH